MYLQQQVELESDLQETVDWCRMWVVDFSSEKLNWYRLTGVITNNTIDVKIDGFVHEEKLSFNMLG